MTFLEKFSRRLGVLEYLGTWNAATNTPALSSGVGQRGGYYVVSAAGSTNLDGENDWNPGDWAIFNGVASKWEKLDNTDEVLSVAGKTGAVTLQAADVTDFNSGVQSEILPRLTKTGLFYVSPAGSDSTGNGGFGSPFKTISAAIASAPAGGVIYLLPGIYDEPTVALPSEIVILGMGSASASIVNGLSHTAGSGEYVDIRIEGLNVASIDLDEGAALNGLVAIRSVFGTVNRSDSSGTTLLQVTESTLIGGTLTGTNTFNECLFIASPTVSGDVSIFENSKFVARVEAEGPATVRMFNCSRFGASEFVNGTAVSSQTPTWEIDLTTEAQGSFTGAITKAILADLTSSKISDFTSAVTSIVSPVYQATKEPTGHENRTQSTVDFDEATRTFTISPVSGGFDVWISGVKQTITTTLSVQIPNTSGNYFFYIDSAGALQYQAAFDLSLFEGKIYTGFVHWNATDGSAVVWGEERHGIVMDGATHSYLHTTRGTQLVSGGAITYTLGNGNAEEDAQIGIADLRVRDEDILVNASHSDTPTNPFEQILFPIAQIPILYREGSEWRRSAANKYPMLVGTNRAQFNEYTGTTWQLTEATANNKTLITYIFATTDFRTPIIGILGQAQYQNLDQAKSLGGWDQITFGDLPAQELKLLYVVFYETSSSHANAVKSAIVDVSDARFTLDRQVSASSFNGDHSNLSGLTNDDHLQYHNDTRGDVRYYTKAQAEALFFDRANHTGTQLASTISDFTEAAQDAVGSAFANSTTIDLTYSDGINQISASVKDGAITDAKVASGIDALKIGSGLVSNAEFATLDGITTGVSIQSQINGKEPSITAGTASQYWRGDKTFQTLDKTAVGLSNVDNVSAADLRTRSTHTGTESTLSWDEVSEPAAPASGLTVYAESVAGRQMFAQKAKVGRAYPFQPSLGAMPFQIWLPNPAATTSTVLGMVAPTANGTATLRALATTNSFTWQRRVGYVSAGTANQSSGLRSAVLQFGTGNGAGLGGFFFQTRFGISDAALVANARSAIGLTATTGAFGNADPSTFLNFVGMAHDSADTNWQIMFNDGAGAATKVDLGANFTRSPAVSTVMYDLTLYCAPNTTTIYYEVKNIANGAVATGTMTTNIPANTQLLTWQLWRQNNGTAAAVGIDIASVYIETEI